MGWIVDSLVKTCESHQTRATNSTERADNLSKGLQAVRLSSEELATESAVKTIAIARLKEDREELYFHRNALRRCSIQHRRSQTYSGRYSRYLRRRET